MIFDDLLVKRNVCALLMTNCHLLIWIWIWIQIHIYFRTLLLNDQAIEIKTNFRALG